MENTENEIFKNVTNHGKECLAQMKILWRHLYGDTESIFLERYELIEKHLKNLLNDMVKEEQDSVVEYKQALSDLLVCRENLQEELCMSIDLPFNPDPEIPNLHNQVKKLTDYIKKYETIKINRLQELVTYKDVEEQLCEKLGEEPRYTAFSSVPSEETLNEIKDYIRALNAEKVERSSNCGSLISEIEELIHDMEVGDNIDNEKLYLLSRDDNVVLSKSRIVKLQEWKIQLMALKDAQIQEITLLKEKTTLLWNLLDISDEDRNEILRKTHKECGQIVLNIWRKELRKCEAIKKQNIKTVILRLRNVIKTLWDDCHLGEEERLKFIHFCSSEYDEHLLEWHEKEEQRLREYYNERKEIFVSAKKWFKLWDKMILLENRSNNTNRYANRGGQLLKEERERKVVQKELPKVESTLEKLITDIEEKTQIPFLYDGCPLLKKIADLWEKRRTEKENEKETRKMQNLNRLTPLKANNIITTPTPARSTQKHGKILTAVENMSAKKLPVRRELKMPASTKKTIRRRSRSHDPKVKYEGKELKDEKNVLNVSVGSYAGFQREIACVLNSTPQS